MRTAPELRSCAAALLALLAAPISAQDAPTSGSSTTASLRAFPSRVTLDDRFDRHRIVCLRVDAQGITEEVGDRVEAVSEPAGLVELRDGLLIPRGNGEGSLRLRVDGLETRVAFVVQNLQVEPPVSFRNDVIPVLTRAGCNGGACHGAAAGKNGFGLTLFGFDPSKDLRALSRDYHGRRLDCAAPEQSLMLTKPTGEVRHKGGKKLEKDSEMWHTLRQWIADGAVDDGDAAPTLVGLRVDPKELVLAGPGQTSRIVVTARYSDGSLRDVTDLALLSSSNPTSAGVADGSVRSSARGEAFVLARFGFLAEVAQVIVLPDAEPWQPPVHVRHNEIDELIQHKLDKLRLLPAPPCDDRTFVRRVSLDITGQLPTTAEVAAFVADERPDKRARLVDELLERPQFPAVWAMLWAEVLRIEPDQIEAKGVHVFTRWLRESLQQGVPIDRIVHRMLTAEGSAYAVPEANFWVTSRDAKVLAENTAQTFLGIRLQCAQCHNHPFERWRMDDYYGFAAFFTQVGRKAGDDPRDTVVYDRGEGGIRNLRTGQGAAPRFLGGDLAEHDQDTDRREVLARWLTSPNNPWFARNVANRVWARFFGRGLVEPVDDVRVSNPPTHPDLHRRLGEKLAAADFDIRVLIREICASATYQSADYASTVDRSAGQPAEAPAGSYAGAQPRRLTAEQLLDAIDSLTEVDTRLRGVPAGGSAVEADAPDPGSRLLDLFGRPQRDSVCTCERREEPTLNQVLHLINGETIERKVRSGDSRIARLLAAGTEPAAMLDELFVAAYARAPRPEEAERILRAIPTDDAKAAAAAWQDVLWAICNSKEFLFQH